jgi:hypothetical protein
MNVSIRQIHPVFVGEVSGIDVARPLSRHEVAAVEAGIDRYAVLVFHDQSVTDEQQMAFTLNFGVLEDARGGNITRRTRLPSWATFQLGATGSRWIAPLAAFVQLATCSPTAVPRDPRQFPVCAWQPGGATPSLLTCGRSASGTRPPGEIDPRASTR